MTTTLRPSDRLGTDLTGRCGAAELRREAERRLAAGETVVFDFTGAAGIAPSFADELLAKLPQDAHDEGRVRIEHLHPAQEQFARFLIANRRVEKTASQSS